MIDFGLDNYFGKRRNAFGKQWNKEGKGRVDLENGLFNINERLLTIVSTIS